MLFILLRKINKNKWMILCLLLGLVLSIGIVSSIPMYSRSILQRVLAMGIENLKVKGSVYPGAYYVNTANAFPNQIGAGEKTQAEAKANIKRMTENPQPEGLAKELNLPIKSSKITLTAPEFTVLNSGENVKYESRPQATIKTIKDFQNHIKIINGRMSSNTKNQNGEYEVIVSEYAYNNLRLKLDVPYSVNYRPEESSAFGRPFLVRITGIYSYKDPEDTYFDSGVWYNPESFIMDYDLYVNEWMQKEDSYISGIGWYFALDYKKINDLNFESIRKKVEDQRIALNRGLFSVIFPAENVLASYEGKKKDMSTMLWVLQAPMLLMLLIYISMMSKLMVEQDKNEISLLKSRGAGTLQVIPIYLLQSLFMGAIAFILGPILGMGICKVLGSANGFLQFVQREPLRVDFRGIEFIYSFIGVLIFIITMLIPVIIAAKKSIVEHKQGKVRGAKRPFWQRMYLDFILLGITGYGFYTFTMRQAIVKQGEISANSLPVDPLLYLVSTFFIIGLGLLFIRIYPYIIKFIFLLGKKKWNPVMYSSLINASRSDGRNQFVMLFLILTLCIGIFNLKAAGTLNANAENNIKYKVGADIVIKTEKENKDGEENAKKKDELKLTNYGSYAGLNGIDRATKIFKKDNITIKYGEAGETTTLLMGIIPYEFATIAWSNEVMLPFHINEYMNALIKEPRAMILSRAFEKKLGFKMGDSVQIKADGGKLINGYVAAFVDYWPSVDLRKEDTLLVVANQAHLEKSMAMRPYEVWATKNSPDAGQLIYEDIKGKQVEYAELQDSGDEIITEKNDPMLQGINGSLTLGFVTTMIITLIGLLIYWIMSIKERTLQFGILRSVGLSFKELIAILSMDQLLISGTSILIGALVGELNSRIFLPFMRMSSNTSKQFLPFTIVSIRGQYLPLYATIILMLVIVSVILARYISRIKMDQALKLGED